jgi:hypothetical protein
MQIANITGVTKSNELQITKSIGALIVQSSLSLDALTTEKISVYVERGNGNNIILANKIFLKDFILASTYGTEAVQSNTTFKTVALCELALHGGILLADKESIKITLEDLIAGETYQLNGVEEPTSTKTMYMFEQKSIASEEYNKKINLFHFDLAVITKSSTISDISFTYENHAVVKYLPAELEVLSRDVDPIQYIKQDGTVSQGLTDRLVMPLVHVDFVEINKTQGTIVNIVVRTVRTV